jgi:hypothetical protein
MPMPERAHISSGFTGWFFTKDFCDRLKFERPPFQREIELASCGGFGIVCGVDFALVKNIFRRAFEKI